MGEIQRASSDIVRSTGGNEVVTYHVQIFDEDHWRDFTDWPHSIEEAKYLAKKFGEKHSLFSFRPIERTVTERVLEE